MAKFRKRTLNLVRLRTKNPPAVLAVYVWRIAVSCARRTGSNVVPVRESYSTDFDSFRSHPCFNFRVLATVGL